MGVAAAKRRWFVPQLLLVTLASLAVLGFIQRSTRGMYGYDGPYHIRYAELLRQDLAAGRGFSHEFPWWQESFLREHWADKDLLYHLLLIPFTFGDLDAGGKAASISFGAALFVCIFLAIRWMRGTAAWLWSLALLLSSTTFVYRAGLVRSHVIAIALAALGAAAILRGCRAGIFLASAAYALSHIGWHLLPGIALIHDLVRCRAVGRFRPGATAWSLAGVAAAILANPYFPDTLRLWYVQNVDVLLMAWSPSSPDLHLGAEFLPGSPGMLAFFDAGPILFTLGGAALVSLYRRRSAPREDDADSVTLGLVTVLFLVLTLLSRRFVDFWAPFSAMFAAAAATRFLEGRKRPPPARRLAMGAAMGIVLGGVGLHCVSQARRIIAEDQGRVFDTCAGWIRDNVPPGQTIFTTDWDEFPDLFFVAPRQNYLIGLDPTFMYVTSPERWRLWRAIAEGHVPDIKAPIAQTFGCRYIFADAGFERFIERADQDPWLRCELRDPDCGVYSIREDAAAAPPLHAVSHWHLGENGTVTPGPSGFIDIESLRGTASPAGTEPDCATVHGTFEVATATSLTFAINTDDLVRISLNGREVNDTATRAAPSLDEILAQQRAGTRRSYEFQFSGDTVAGYNDLSVSTCRAGHAWGFFLRILDR